MSIEYLRDLVIVVFGVVASGLVLMLGIMAIVVYRRVRLMQESLANTIAFIESLVTMGGEMQKAFVQFSSVIPGIWEKVASFVRPRGKEATHEQQ